MHLDASKLKEALKIVEPGATDGILALFQGGWIMLIFSKEWTN